MTVYLALLRGINVGGRNQVAMADLRHLLAQLDCGDVRSLLQSGNLVFRSNATGGARLERLLRAKLEESLGLQTDVLVRTKAEWKTIVAHNPFPNEAAHNPGQLLAMFLSSAPSATDVKALQAATRGPEVLRADGKQVYIVYPDGIGRSRLTNSAIESHLGTRGTGRNWNTVLKLAALAEELTKSPAGAAQHVWVRRLSRGSPLPMRPKAARPR